MQHLSQVNKLLTLIAGRNGISGLELNADGVCTLKYSNTNLTLEYVVPAQCLSLYAPLLSESVILDSDHIDEAQLYKTLLALNLISPDLLGTTFAYLPGDELIVLSDRVPLEQLDADILEARLNTFLVLAEAWKYKFLKSENIVELMNTISEAEAEDIEGLILGKGVEPPRESTADKKNQGFQDFI